MNHLTLYGTIDLFYYILKGNGIIIFQIKTSTLIVKEDKNGKHDRDDES